jgi:molecular chaperone GrpE
MFPKKKDNSKEEQQQASSTSSGQAAPQEQPKAEPVPSASSGRAVQDIQELQKQLEWLRKEKDDIFAKLQRVAADYDNYQKRSTKQTTEAVAHETEKIIKALLPVMDDFERVLVNAQCSENADVVMKGIGIVYEHLKGVLRLEGVEQIDAAGEKFDPARHQALTQRAEQGKENGIVLEELQKGYKLNGRLIRASRVVINKTPEPQTSPQPEEPETKDTQ